MIVGVPLNLLYDNIAWFCMFTPNFKLWSWKETESILDNPIYNNNDDNLLDKVKEDIAKKQSFIEIKTTSSNDDDVGTKEKENKVIDKLIQTVYDTYKTSELEADEILTLAHQFLSDYTDKTSIPWSNTEHLVEQSKYKALQDLLGIYPNGNAIPLSIWDSLWYSSPRDKLIAKIEKIREKVIEIKEEFIK